jgi:hypothetical protein
VRLKDLERRLSKFSHICGTIRETIECGNKEGNTGSIL